MRIKKQRILSFFMAFLLIFSFAFINPLTMQKSYGALPALLSIPAQRIITGVVTSSGVLTRVTQSAIANSVKIDKAIKDFASIVFLTLSLQQRQELLALDITEDNKVEVPTDLYDAIKNNAEQLALPQDFSATLEEQSISTEYATITSSSSDYYDLNFPVYVGNFTNGKSLTQLYDMSEAEPFFTYTGNSTDTAINKNNITSSIFMVGDNTEDIPDHPYSANGRIYGNTESLSIYNIPVYSPDYHAVNFDMSYQRQTTTTGTLDIRLYDDNSHSNQLIRRNSSTDPQGAMGKFPIYNNILNLYFIKVPSQDGVGIFMEILDLEGNVKYQDIDIDQLTTTTGNGYGLGVLINNSLSNTINSDLIFEKEANPTPVKTNTENTANILNLPSELQGIIESTSESINTETIVPDIPEDNTETIENINTNVGELVTGGALGEQVNTNIGTLEGLHGEITDQVDFGAVFDTIAQYISSLDISSVTWFPVAVASFLSPFLPVISLGIILFFLDRVLNGGA